MSGDLSIRKAEPKDARFLYDIRNDTAVVEASATGKGVDWNAHVLWFRQKLRENALLFIAEANNSPVGYIRFDEVLGQTDTFEVAVGLVERYRGRGLGTTLISRGSLLAEALGAQKLIARIRPSNIASLRAFGAAGYRRDPDHPTTTSETGIRLDHYVRFSFAHPRSVPAVKAGDITTSREPHIPSMPKKGRSVRIVLVADFGRGAGLGHLRRMQALGDAIAKLGSKYALAVTSMPKGEDILFAREIVGRAILGLDVLLKARGVFDAAVVDSYRLSERVLADIDPSLMLADGLRPPVASPIVVDPSPGAREKFYAGVAEKVLVGPDYALLAHDLCETKFEPAAYPPKKILVSLGSAATASFVAEVARHLKDRLAHIEVAVPKPNTLPSRYLELLFSSDMVITAGGVSSLEAARTGRPSIGVVLAPNQRQNIEGLSSGGALLEVPANARAIATAAEELSTNQRLFRRLQAAGPRMVDGKGASRVATALLESLKGDKDESTEAPSEEPP